MTLIEIKDRANEVHFINTDQIARIYFDGVIGRAGATTIELSSGTKIYVEKPIKEICTIAQGYFMWGK